jgi:hypothetical protein
VRFTDSGVNTEYRALSAPVSSLSVGATSYTLGTVGALGANQFGNSGGYVYVKGNPGSSTVTATPTTQSTAANNAVAVAGLSADTVTGLTNGGGTNSYDIGSPSPRFLGGDTPTTAEGLRPTYDSPLVGAGTPVGVKYDFSGYRFNVPPSIGAFEVPGPSTFKPFQ